MRRKIISSFVTRGAIALCNLAILLIVTRMQGSEVLGKLSLLIVNMTVIQTLIDIYTGPALVYFIPGARLRHIYGMGVLWILCGGIVLTALVVFFDVRIRDIWIHLFVLSVVSTLQAFHNVILLARERIRIYNLLLFMQPAILLIVLIVNVLVLKNTDVYSNIYAMYCSWFISVICSSVFIWPLMNKTPEGAKRLRFMEMFKNGFINQLGNLAHILSNRFNYYMLSTIALVGVYGGATSLIESALIISASISPLVLTRIANRKGEGDESRMSFLLAKISFLLSSLLVLLVVLVPAEVFTQLLGKDFSGARSIMLRLAPGVLCISFSSILSHYFSGLGRQKILLLANSSGLIVTLILSYPLISVYGVYGACYAASLAYFTQSAVLTFIFMKENRLSFSALFSFRRDLSVLEK